MAPYDALYGRSCRSPLCWTEVGERSITGPDLIRDTLENVSLIRQRLLIAQSQQKRYFMMRLSREVIVEVYWTFRDTREDRQCCVLVGFTAQHVRCPRGISRLHAPEVYAKSSSCSGLRTDRG